MARKISAGVNPVHVDTQDHREYEQVLAKLVG